MKRRLVALFFVVCVIGFSVVWLFLRNRSIDQTTYDAIELGMSEDEAVARVPRVPGTIAFTSAAELLAEEGTTQFNDNQTFIKTDEPGVFVYFDLTTRKQVGTLRCWQTYEYSFQVLSSPDGKVIGKHLARFKDAEARRWNDLLWLLP